MNTRTLVRKWLTLYANGQQPGMDDAFALMLKLGDELMDEYQKLAANTAAMNQMFDKLAADLAAKQDLEKQVAALKDQITQLQNAPPPPADPSVTAANQAISDGLAKLTAAGA